MEQQPIDKVFNLQIVIQKLEEELTLYRNGTTGPELLEMIREKETESNALKLNLDQTKEKLRQLAKSSADVITRYDVLLTEKNELSQQLSDTEGCLVRAEQTIKTTKQELKTALLQKTSLENECVNHIAVISKLESENLDVTATVGKLQARCASLVSEKSEKSRLLETEKEERLKQVQEIRDEYERAMRVNTELKIILTKDRKQNTELVFKLKESQCKTENLSDELSAANELSRGTKFNILMHLFHDACTLMRN